MPYAIHIQTYPLSRRPLLANRIMPNTPSSLADLALFMDDQLSSNARPPLGDHQPAMPETTPTSDDGAAADPTERAIAQLRALGFKVLPPFNPTPRVYATPNADADIATGVFLDTETTGLGGTARVIQVAAARFTFDKRTGHILAVTDTYSALEDPGVPIDPEATKVHGLSDADVAGQRFDDARMTGMCQDADILVAHNAEFDVPKLETRFPAINSKRWACSYKDVPWREAYDQKSAKLGHLLEAHTGEHLDAHAHDALADCLAGIHILATPGQDGRQPMADLIESANQVTVIMLATGTPFHTKDSLKDRKYKWNDGDKPDAKFPGVRAWYTAVALAEEGAERAWLAAEIYKKPDPATLPLITQQVDATTRYSKKVGGA